MRIAFVGKGGSGKSTVSALFARYIISKNYPLALFDADLNIHLPKLLGEEIPVDKHLSQPQNVQKIKKHLIGSNSRVASVSHMYKTTPPATGSNLFCVSGADYLIKEFSQKIAPNSFLFAVGTYDTHEVGRSCYHVNLSILENILSHNKSSTDEWIVVDMVAGIDAFANTLHAQFDLLVLVVEPTTESLDVFEQYKLIGNNHDIVDRLFVVGNKLEDEGDEDFIKNAVGDKYLGGIYKSPDLKLARRSHLPVHLSMIANNTVSLFADIEVRSRSSIQNNHSRLQKLYALHQKYADQAYVKNAVGDITTQIDPEYHL